MQYEWRDDIFCILNEHRRREAGELLAQIMDLWPPLEVISEEDDRNGSRKEKGERRQVILCGKPRTRDGAEEEHRMSCFSGGTK